MGMSHPDSFFSIIELILYTKETIGVFRCYDMPLIEMRIRDKHYITQKVVF